MGQQVRNGVRIIHPVPRRRFTVAHFDSDRPWIIGEVSEDGFVGRVITDKHNGCVRHCRSQPLQGHALADIEDGGFDDVVSHGYVGARVRRCLRGIGSSSCDERLRHGPRMEHRGERLSFDSGACNRAGQRLEPSRHILETRPLIVS